MQIAFLHTIAANQSLFDQAAHDLDIPTDRFHHLHRPELREAVVAAGGINDALRSQLHAILQTLAANAEAVVVTCATLGAAIDERDAFPVLVLRADAALARAATAEQGKLTVLCGPESAVASVQALYRAYGKDTGLITVTPLPEVWTSFIGADLDACNAGIAAAISQAYASGADSVALAHPWMASASLLAKGRQPFDIPHAALKALIAHPTIRSR